MTRQDETRENPRAVPGPPDSRAMTCKLKQLFSDAFSG
jgi:hypothetical protein